MYEGGNWTLSTFTERTSEGKFLNLFSFYITHPSLLAPHQVTLIVLLLFPLYRAKEKQWEQFIGSKS